MLPTMIMYRVVLVQLAQWLEALLDSWVLVVQRSQMEFLGAMRWDLPHLVDSQGP